jgi:2-polyprenyl-3-methyl-5-hydroxy-6-metoxy-1,4-benzoquinol methylase
VLQNNKTGELKVEEVPHPVLMPRGILVRNEYSLISKGTERIKKEISMNEEVTKLQSVVDKLLSNRKTIRVLEAGCGSSSHISMRQNAYIVGIDISEKQLLKNSFLDENILGDIQSYNLPTSDFDMIVCWDVLEHLSQPERALRNFLKAVKENGIIILALPNVLSIKGLITKYTPYWFHVWAYRSLFGSKPAGTDDFGPFRTFLKFSIAPASIKRFALGNGLSIEYFSIYESQMQKKLREKYKLVNAILALLGVTTRALSLGKIDVNLTDYIIVLKKRKTNDANLAQPSKKGSPYGLAKIPLCETSFMLERLFAIFDSRKREKSMLRHLIDSITDFMYWVKRKRIITPKGEVVKLNIGSGLSVALGWTNVDASLNAFFSELSRSVIQKLPNQIN